VSDDDPMEPLGEGGTWNNAVVDFAGYKIAAGRRPWKSPPCEHKRLLYDRSDRRVWCEACAHTIDSFDAFMALADRFQEIANAARNDRQQAADALAAVIIRRGAKAIDRAWGRKMAPCCPHCHRGLLPHDFAGGAASAVGFEWENARRKGALNSTTEKSRDEVADQIRRDREKP
jgi:hypothetical protein